MRPKMIYKVHKKGSYNSGSYEHGILRLGKRLIASYIPEKTAEEICKKHNGYDKLKAERDKLIFYAWHKCGCPRHSGSENLTCTCGFSKLEQALKEGKTNG